MRGRLSRKRARATIVLFAVGLIALIASYVAEGWLPIVVAVITIFGGMMIRPGKCPTCGRRVNPMPQWSQPGKNTCPYCRNRLAYDDETEEE